MKKQYIKIKIFYSLVKYINDKTRTNNRIK